MASSGELCYESIESIKIVYGDEDTNNHLRDGWIFLKIVENHSTTETSKGLEQHTSIVSVVGWRRSNSRGSSQVQPQHSTSSMQSAAAPKPTNTQATPATQNTSNTQPTQQTQSASGHKLKPCRNNCGGEIYLEQQDGRWLPFNPDGSPHRCQQRS